MMARRTYSHLESLKRKPTEYEIVTSNLLYYPTRGFEVNVPLTGWYAKHRLASPFRCSDWEKFRDPRETTYTKYTEIQKAKEIFVDGLLCSIDDRQYDKGLSPSAIELLARVLPPLRYPIHGLQMIAAYVGQMAPSGRIVITCACQAADEIRRVQRLSYRMRQVQETRPGFGDDAKALWQSDPAWQPWRELIEKLLVTYDWGEALVALNLVVKPWFDELFMNHFGRVMDQLGDGLLRQLFFSLNEDCAWHRSWSAALIGMVLEEDPANQTAIAEWIARWNPLARRSVEAFSTAFTLPDSSPALHPQKMVQELDAFVRGCWISAGLGNGS